MMAEPYGLSLDTRNAVRQVDGQCERLAKQLLNHHGPLSSSNLERLIDCQASAESLLEIIKFLRAQQEGE